MSDELTKRLLDAVDELPNSLMADLETGSHFRNNLAARDWADKHPEFTKQLNIVCELARNLREKTS